MVLPCVTVIDASPAGAEHVTVKSRRPDTRSEPPIGAWSLLSELEWNVELKVQLGPFSVPDEPLKRTLSEFAAMVLRNGVASAGAMWLLFCADCKKATAL